jgi:hypothetical protein
MHAEYLLTVGKLTQNAGITDLMLFSAFRVVSACEERIAHAIFYSHESVNAKAQMLRRVLEVAGDDEDRRVIAEIIEATKKAHEPRNELAHALVLSTEADPEAPLSRLSLKAQKQPTRPITPEYLASLMQRSGEARDAGVAAYAQLCARRGISDVPKLVPTGKVKS